MSHLARLALCASGYYDGTIFHRNIKSFMIQGGDPTRTGCCRQWHLTTLVVHNVGRVIERLPLGVSGSAVNSSVFKSLVSPVHVLLHPPAQQSHLGEPLVEIKDGSARNLYPGYVQFTSPISPFSNLIGHYLVKAHMRGEPPPFGTGNVEAKMAMANLRTKDARKLQMSLVRYWTIEYLQRQPKDREYPAIVMQDGEVYVLLQELGFRSSATLTSTPSVGSDMTVVVVIADPRKDVICLRQC